MSLEKSIQELTKAVNVLAGIMQGTTTAGMVSPATPKNPKPVTIKEEPIEVTTDALNAEVLSEVAPEKLSEYTEALEEQQARKKEVTFEELTELATLLVKTHKLGIKAKKVLQGYGAANLKNVDKEDYVAVHHELSQLLP